MMNYCGCKLFVTSESAKPCRDFRCLPSDCKGSYSLFFLKSYFESFVLTNRCKGPSSSWSARTKPKRSCWSSPRSPRLSTTPISSQPVLRWPSASGLLGTRWTRPYGWTRFWQRTIPSGTSTPRLVPSPRPRLPAWTWWSRSMGQRTVSSGTRWSPGL